MKQSYETKLARLEEHVRAQREERERACICGEIVWLIEGEALTDEQRAAYARMGECKADHRRAPVQIIEAPPRPECSRMSSENEGGMK